jgi:hypothetical protein
MAVLDAVVDERDAQRDLADYANLDPGKLQKWLDGRLGQGRGHGLTDKLGYTRVEQWLGKQKGACVYRDAHGRVCNATQHLHKAGGGWPTWFCEAHRCLQCKGTQVRKMRNGKNACKGCCYPGK